MVRKPPKLDNTKNDFKSGVKQLDIGNLQRAGGHLKKEQEAAEYRTVAAMLGRGKASHTEEKKQEIANDALAVVSDPATIKINLAGEIGIEVTRLNPEQSYALNRVNTELGMHRLFENINSARVGSAPQGKHTPAIHRITWDNYVMLCEVAQKDVPPAMLARTHQLHSEYAQKQEKMPPARPSFSAATTYNNDYVTTMRNDVTAATIVNNETGDAYADACRILAQGIVKHTTPVGAKEKAWRLHVIPEQSVDGLILSKASAKAMTPPHHRSNLIERQGKEYKITAENFKWLHEQAGIAVPEDFQDFVASAASSPSTPPQKGTHHVSPRK